MLDQWLGVVLQTSIQVALAILPAAPLLGQKLPSIADEKKLMNNAQLKILWVVVESADHAPR